jgi:2-(1,2-epoxy-1,2-dihydrophenyl)acetyl-CoA isomerase
MSTTVSTPLVTEKQGGVLTLTLNRPEALNSLNTELLAALAEAIDQAATDDAVRAVVITGAGRGFCAGQDLKEELLGGGADIGEHLRSHYLPVVEGMRRLEKPVIAAVNGVAAGAGLSLALAADLRIASDSASFCQAFVRIGLVPDAGGTFYLPRLIGLGRAMEMAMLGDSIDAQEALRIGLVNRVVDHSVLGSAAAELASRLAKGPRSVGLIKQVLHQSFENDFAAQFAAEERAQMAALGSDDFREGVTAFLEKRPPAFSGK